MAAAARTPSEPRPARVRWDRVGRVALLFALVVLLYLAISPLRALVADMHRSSQLRAQLQTYQRQHAALVATDHALQQRSTSDAEARNLGLVRPGERSYVVTALPNN